MDMVGVMSTKKTIATMVSDLEKEMAEARKEARRALYHMHRCEEALQELANSAFQPQEARDSEMLEALQAVKRHTAGSPTISAHRILDIVVPAIQKGGGTP